MFEMRTYASGGEPADAQEIRAGQPPAAPGTQRPPSIIAVMNWVSRSSGLWGHGNGIPYGQARNEPPVAPYAVAPYAVATSVSGLAGSFVQLVLQQAAVDFGVEEL